MKKINRIFFAILFGLCGLANASNFEEVKELIFQMHINNQCVANNYLDDLDYEALDEFVVADNHYMNNYGTPLFGADNHYEAFVEIINWLDFDQFDQSVILSQLDACYDYIDPDDGDSWKENSNTIRLHKYTHNGVEFHWFQLGFGDDDFEYHIIFQADSCAMIAGFYIG